jgi:two-component system nitrogen regulation response regulator NtrX
MSLSASLTTLPLREAREAVRTAIPDGADQPVRRQYLRTASFVGMERSALHRKLKSLGVVTSNKAGARVAQVEE